MRIPACLIGEDLDVKRGLFLEDERVFEEREVGKEIERVIMPSFFNSHVHLMDSITLAPKMSLEELVGPEGYKFKILAETKDENLIKANRKAIHFALKNGTTGMADFREMGARGLRILQLADNLGTVLALARPGSIKEAKSILKLGIEGFGMSSVRDHDYGFLEELREVAKRNRIYFGIHAGERDGGDVERALALEPDFIVHMNQASPTSLRTAIDEMIPIISCIRSNFFFGLENRNNYLILSEYEKWGIGTDNAMVATPSILDEIKFTSHLLPAKNLLKAAFFGFKLFRVQKKWIVLEIPALNPIDSVVRGYCRILGVLDTLKIE
jgi:cytosine/adenosine deaminase-related metal-dependent hydrolase